MQRSCILPKDYQLDSGYWDCRFGNWCCQRWGWHNCLLSFCLSMELLIWSMYILLYTPLWTDNFRKQLLGGLSYLYRATSNQSYLDYTVKITAKAINTFASTGVAEEFCETDASCNQDQQDFKVRPPPRTRLLLQFEWSAYPVPGNLSATTRLLVSHD